MGTSKAYGGPANGLVPSFVDNPPEPTLARPPTQGAAGPQTTQSAQHSSPPPDNNGVGSLRHAKGNFTRFARSGSSSALGRSIANYVRNGTGGARRASRRMGSSRVAASGLLGIVRDIQQTGAAQALQRLNLGNLAGQPAENVFVALLEFICPPGGTVDEGIARQAMVDTIADTSEIGAGTFDTLTREQLNEFFLGFIVHSIEGRVIADLGKNGIALPDDVNAVEQMQDQLHDFVSGATRGVLSGRLNDIASLTDRDIEDRVNQIYEVAFEMIAVAGENAE